MRDSIIYLAVVMYDIYGYYSKIIWNKGAGPPSKARLYIRLYNA